MTNAIKELFLPLSIKYKIMGAMPYLPEIDDDNALLTYMKKCGDALRQTVSDNILNDIAAFNGNHEQSILIIRGLPIDLFIPPTPYHGNQSLQSMPLAVAVNLGLYDLLGLHPVTYWGENEGHLFRHVVPNKSSMDEKSSHGSKYTLGMHVDNCHLPLVSEKHRTGLSPCPEFLSLLGIRCDLTVFTKVAILDEALKLLSFDTIEQLKQHHYILKMPDSFIDSRSYELPILVEGEGGILYGRFDKEYTSAQNHHAQVAFDELSQALLSNQAVNYFLLQTGDFLIFKNQRVTHAREKFTPRFDGTDRWLLRLFGINDLSLTIPVDKTKPYCIAA